MQEQQDSMDNGLRIAPQPVLDGWKLARGLHLVQQLENAMEAGKCSCGLKDVWNTATHKKGRLLVVEEDYLIPANHGTGATAIYPSSAPFKDSIYLRDVVEDVIEKVLKNGGDVEFVEAGILINYQYIALME